MNAYALLEALILALAFIASAGFALRRLAPALWQGLGKAARKRGLGELLAQRLFGATAANCSSGCATCGGCSASETPRGTAQSIRFHHRP